MINKQRFSYNLYLKHIPVSKNLKRLIDTKIVKKISTISQVDDYQILFTASTSKSRIISKISRSLGIKISKIGKICNHPQKSKIFDEKNEIITLKNKGYFHEF
jgi:thiamine-monophosphate kinase